MWFPVRHLRVSSQASPPYGLFMISLVAVVRLIFPQEALISDVLLKPLLLVWGSSLWPMVLLPYVFQGPALVQFYSLDVVLVFG